MQCGPRSLVRFSRVGCVVANPALFELHDGLRIKWFRDRRRTDKRVCSTAPYDGARAITGLTRGALIHILIAQDAVQPLEFIRIRKVDDDPACPSRGLFDVDFGAECQPEFAFQRC